MGKKHQAQTDAVVGSTATEAKSEPNAEELSEAEWRCRQIERNQEAIKLLDSWLVEGDAEEQRETWEWLQKALDRDRLSDRKLFP